MELLISLQNTLLAGYRNPIGPGEIAPDLQARAWFPAEFGSAGGHQIPPSQPASSG